MNESLTLLGVALGIAWVGALASRQTRNWRFVVFLGAVSIIVVSAARYGGTVGRLVEVAVGGVGGAALLWPGRFRLSSLDSVDREADAVLRGSTAAMGTSGPPDHAALTFLPALHAPPFTTPDSPWRPVGRCYQVILHRLGDSDSGESPDRTPLGAFRRAGLHYWRLALDRRVIGRQHQPTAWDEDVLLRCFLDEFDRLIPPGSSLTPFEGHDGWDSEARQRIDEVDGLHLHHPLPSANGRLVRDAMAARLVVALGDRSDPAVDRMRTTSAAISSDWRPPDEEPAKAESV